MNSLPLSVSETCRCFSSSLDSASGLQLGNELVDRDVEIGLVFERAGNDQRRARFVDQDRVDLVDDGERMPALHHLLRAHLHVVAQVVEAELVVGRIGHVAGVLRLALSSSRSCTMQPTVSPRNL